MSKQKKQNFKMDRTQKCCKFSKSSANTKEEEVILQVYDKKKEEFQFPVLSNVNDLNQLVRDGFVKDVVNIFEVLQERRISGIAWKIAHQEGVRIVMVAGPSASGKTTFSKRLSLYLLAHKLKPISLSLDDYFVDRDLTPRDDKGDYDFESLYALDLRLFHQHMTQLLSGEEVELPKYNFVEGKSCMSGRKLRLQPDMILILEGIHGLNPELTRDLPAESIYRIFASALSDVMIGDGTILAKRDNRLLRRMVRDARYRGADASNTLGRWQSVINGEEKWIFPCQQYADAQFNSSMMYEVAVLKEQAMGLLAEVKAEDEGYGKAQQLLEILGKYESIDEKYLPPTSLLREFLGGSNFHY